MITILSIILMILVAAACAWIADYFAPGAIPGGILTAAIFGLIGGWIGVSLFGAFGPSLAGVSLLPTILGSAIFITLLTLLSRGMRGSKA